MFHRHIMEHRSELRSITSHNHFITSIVLVMYFHTNNMVQKQQRATAHLKGLWRVLWAEQFFTLSDTLRRLHGVLARQMIIVLVHDDETRNWI